PLDRSELPGQLCAFTAGVLRTEAFHPPGYYDLIHSHYWLSGQVGWLAAERWRVPLVHTAHTLARVKNAALAEGDKPEPRGREIGEQQVVDAADRLVANTAVESAQLVELYGADPAAVSTVLPGVDLERFTPGSQVVARAELGLPSDAIVLAFAGRIQPLKAPDVLLRAAAVLLERHPQVRDRLVVLIVGGPSGTGLDQPTALRELAHQLGSEDVTCFIPPHPADRLVQVCGAPDPRLGVGRATRFIPPQPADGLVQDCRAADVVAVPTHNESFGLVALEAQACGTPVVAAEVGGLPLAVRHGVSGLLVPAHRSADWADALGAVALRPGERARLSAGAYAHAADFSWRATTDKLLAAYAAGAAVG